MKSARSNRGPIIPVTLKEVYEQTGTYAAKLLISSAFSSTVDAVKVDMRDPDGMSMDMSYKRWGTKLNIEFKITDDTPDGVAIIDIRMTSAGKETVERFDCWIIK